jgi:predicted CXXCH cytochrome family protein
MKLPDRFCAEHAFPTIGRKAFGLLWLAPFALLLPETAGASEPGVRPPMNIKGTPHNLRGKNVSASGDEVCVFCHTPQVQLGGAMRAGIASPAWQRGLSPDHAYVIYDDIGRRQFNERPAVGSQSIACMSCHDYAQAFGITSGPDDHPVSMPYRGYTPDGRTNTSSAPTIDVRATGGVAPRIGRPEQTASYDDFRLPSMGTLDNRSIWWVSAEGITARRTREDVPLYGRRALDGSDVPHVECSSCHDPHGTRPLFLRVSNDGSRLCLTCHDK